MAQLPCIGLPWPLTNRHLLGVAIAIYFHYGVYIYIYVWCIYIYISIISQQSCDFHNKHIVHIFYLPSFGDSHRHQRETHESRTVGKTHWLQDHITRDRVVQFWSLDKSGDHQLRLIVSPIIYRFLYIPGGGLGFLPSAVAGWKIPIFPGKYHQHGWIFKATLGLWVCSCWLGYLGGHPRTWLSG